MDYAIHISCYTVSMHEVDLKYTKNSLRKTMKAILSAMDTETRNRLSVQAVDNFMMLSEYKAATIVLAFLSMREELQTGSLIARGLKDGKAVAVPKMGFSDEHGDFIEFLLLSSDYKAWPLDRFGIPEPPEKAQELSLEELGRSQVVVAVPGLAFDLRGGRMGRGKGYYDRFLASARASAVRYGGSFLACGICFESQIVETVPMGSWDQRVDYLTTEDMLIKSSI